MTTDSFLGRTCHTFRLAQLFCDVDPGLGFSLHLSLLIFIYHKFHRGRSIFIYSHYKYYMKQQPIDSRRRSNRGFVPINPSQQQPQQPPQYQPPQQLPPPRLQKQSSSLCSHQTNSQLAKELQRIKRTHQQKKDDLFNLHRGHRVEISRNTKLKAEYAQGQKKAAEFKRKQIQKMMQEFHNNKESPLFHNEHGLAPFQLMQLPEQRYNQIQGNICMICFMDLSQNAKIIILPCAHFVHKDCGVQHLLYSKLCPACNQVVTVPQ